MKSIFILFICFILSFSQDELIHFDSFSRSEVQSQAFELDSEEEVTIEVIGPRMGHYKSSSYVWILNLETREPVWYLDDAESERESNRRLRKYTDSFTLKKGVYKVYYATNRNNNFFNNGDFNFLDLFKSSTYSGEFRRSDLRKFELTLSTDGDLIKDDSKYLEKLGGERIVNMSKADRNVYERVQLNVKSSTDVYIYAIGEVTRDGNYDSAWLKNLDTGDKVWELDRYESEYAGGGEKNRMFKNNLKLDKGTYLLTFITDDSHEYDDWNVIPPYDPEAWGISIYTEDADDIEITDYTATEEKNAIVNLTELGDNEYVTKGFTLEKDGKVRIYALGEGYRSDMADYGWIVNTETRRKVWEMDYRDTDHAGGASKNRMVDEVIRLDKGSYKVYFVTDDSHSYADRFNASRPYDDEKWGITVYAAGGLDLDDVTQYKEAEEKNVLVKLTRLRDDEYESEIIELDEDTEVRIYAIGEGFRHDMADYGWIKNVDTGRKVWRMDYEDTDHAGGARKNRVVDEVITLRKGTYKVYFKTDGSHSFRDWNERPPMDQENWGITVYAMSN